MPGDFDQVKERIDIVQLIGERVALKKAADLSLLRLFRTRRRLHLAREDGWP